MNGTTTASTARGIAWLSLIFSVIALLFAVSAYGVSRTGAQSVPDDRERGAAATTTLEDSRREAGQALQAARANLQNNQNYEAAAVQVEQAEDRLQTAYRDLGEEGSQQWQELKASFDDVEESLRSQSARALQKLENLIAAFAQDLRVDEKPERAGE